MFGFAQFGFWLDPEANSDLDSHFLSPPVTVRGDVIAFASLGIKDGRGNGEIRPAVSKKSLFFKNTLENCPKLLDLNSKIVLSSVKARKGDLDYSQGSQRVHDNRHKWPQCSLLFLCPFNVQTPFEMRKVSP